MTRTVTGTLVASLLLVAGGAPRAATQPAVAVGFSIRQVASGLDGAQGMALMGAGQIAVVEQIDRPRTPDMPPPRLTLVRQNGTRRVLASASAGASWFDVKLDPSRGFLLGSVLSPRGIDLVHHNGDLDVFAPFDAHVTGIALDDRTGDLFLARFAPRQAPSIVRMRTDGTVSVFKAGVRAAGMIITADRRLIAAVQRRTAAALTNEVVSYDLEDGSERVLASGVGTLVGSVAVSRSGDIFVSDFDDGQVRRIACVDGDCATAEFASAFSTESRRYPGGPFFPGLSFNSLAFDPAGRLYVSDYAAGRIFVIEGPF